MSAQAEQWRVSTIEGVFETDLETLKQWIVEGCVLPTDKVAKGKLSWIEAGRAPMLRAAFAGEVSIAPSNGEATTLPETSVAEEHLGVLPEERRSEPLSQLATACHNHPDQPPTYICRVCGASFCADCPRFVGSTPICSLCGDMCKPYDQVRTMVQRQSFQSSGFGMEDFGRALTYPFQHKIALLFGALMYGFLQLAGFRGKVIAFVIMFGCISHVISQVAWGKLDRSFLPDFSAFSMWDDVAIPIGLGIGIAIVTWGPTIVLVLAIMFGVVNGPKLSPLHTAAADRQSAPVTPQDLGALTDPEADPKKLEAANSKLNEVRPGSVIAKEAKESQEKLNDPTASLRMLTNYLYLPVVLVMLFLLSLAWAIFYGPMALSVAGYTEHFGSVVNPLVGLDTIRRMGGTYFKAFFMVILVQILGLVISIIVATITAPLSMPFFGNLPANFIDGSFTFYFNLVIACVLGLSLHKCADKLGIEAKA